MEETNAPEPPPLLPELEELSAGAAGAPRAREGTGGFALADGLALLRNRFLLSGIAVLVVLLLIAVVLVVIGNGDGGPRRRSVAVAGTTDGETTAVPRSGVVGHVRTTATMRRGPGATYFPVGTIPRGALVPVVGRNADDSWLQVSYPPGSQLRGWVDVAFIEVTGDISQLAVAGPSAGPSVSVPTSVATVVGVTFEPSPTLSFVTLTPRATRTPRPTSTRFPTRTPRPTGAMPTVTQPVFPTTTPTAPVTPQLTPTPPLPTETPVE